MLPILVTFTSHSDSDFERSNISLKENKRDGADSNSNGFDYCIQKNEGKFYGFQPESTVSNEANFMPSKKIFITGQSKVSEPDVAVGKSTPQYLSSSGTCLVFPWDIINWKSFMKDKR